MFTCICYNCDETFHSMFVESDLCAECEEGMRAAHTKATEEPMRDRNGQSAHDLMICECETYGCCPEVAGQRGEDW